MSAQAEARCSAVAAKLRERADKHDRVDPDKISYVPIAPEWLRSLADELTPTRK